jgi:hypothetical protein
MQRVASKCLTSLQREEFFNTYMEDAFSFVGWGGLVQTVKNTSEYYTQWKCLQLISVYDISEYESVLTT